MTKTSEHVYIVCNLSSDRNFCNPIAAYHDGYQAHMYATKLDSERLPNNDFEHVVKQVELYR